MTDLPKFTVPSLTPEEGRTVADALQGRLHALNDLALFYVQLDQPREAIDYFKRKAPAKKPAAKKAPAK